MNAPITHLPKCSGCTIAGWLVLLWLAVLAAACTEEAPEARPVVRPVKILTIGGPGAGARREYPATVKAAQHADIGFEVPGKVTEFLVKEGDFVEEGAILARLDDRDYQADLDQAEASLRKAQSDLNRSLGIFEEDPGAISKQAIDADRRAVEVTEAEVRKAEKAVEDTVLKAQFAGLVARKLVEDFANVQAKEPVLVLQDISHLEVEVSLPERDVAKGTTKKSTEEITASAKPEVVIASIPGHSFPARVSEFATTADPATRTFQVRLTFDNPMDVSILPGMTARVLVNVGADQGIRIPVSAVLGDPQLEPFVWKVDPETRTVSRVLVELGPLQGSEVQIKGGLASGDQIAVSGVHQLEEGMKVRRYGN
jgi:RND family efflux transporter MFP subunit